MNTHRHEIMRPCVWEALVLIAAECDHSKTQAPADVVIAAIAEINTQELQCSSNIIWPIFYNDLSLGPAAPNSIPAI